MIVNQMNQVKHCDLYPNPFECDSSHYNYYKIDIETEINSPDEIILANNKNNNIDIDLYTKIASFVCCIGVYLFINYMV